MLSRILTLTIVCLLLAASAGPLAQARWRRVDTPNFVVIGDVSGGELREVGARFEGFRDALGRILNERLIATVVPAVIVVFSTDDVYKPFKPKYQGRPAEVAGAFMPGRDINYITIGNREHLETLFHEYTHLLVSNSGVTMPLWLGEGFAEYYSTLQFQRSGREVLLGGLIDEHLEVLNDTTLIPLEQFLQLTHDSPLYNEGSRQSVFYAQSWAVTHMLHHGKPDRRAELSAYLQRVTSGMPSVDAWKATFGGVDVMKDLRQYVRQRLFTVAKMQLQDNTSAFEKLPVADLSRSDADAYLGQILVRLNESDAAAARLAAARQREPGNPRIRMTDAMLAVAKDDYALAVERLDGLESGDDWLLAYQAGITLADVMEEQSAALTDANLAAVRARFAASARARPMLPHAAYRVASLEARRGTVSSDTKAALDRARTQTPGRHEYHLLYAQILGSARDFNAAREVLGPLMTPRTPPHVRDLARRLMGVIAEAEIGKPLSAVSVDAVTSAAIPPPASTAAATETTDREPIVRPVYRDIKPGETRLEGVLQSIECVTGKGVTFRVSAQDRVELFTVPKFDSVEFITYRKDLAGNIGCGPLKPPMAVYLTWRAGTTPETRVPVAIEFLPAR